MSFECVGVPRGQGHPDSVFFLLCPPHPEEYVVVLRHILELRPTANQDQLQLCIDMMRCVVRLGLQHSERALTAQCKEFWEGTLLAVASSAAHPSLNRTLIKSTGNKNERCF